MVWPELSETTIRQYAEAESFARGRDYADRGAVIALTRRGETLEAEVRGSAALPYHVRCDFATPHLITATCTCPYDWGGWCKHIVAACLVAMRHPAAVAERATPEALLAGLDADRLRALLLDLIRADPAALATVERQIAKERVVAADSQPPGGAPPRSSAPAVDARAVRREVRGIFHSLDRMRASEAYWHVGSVVGEVSDLVERTRAHLEAGDAAGALAMLDGITEEAISEVETLDDSNGEIGMLFADLGTAWTEALLTAELKRAERETWASKIEGWMSDLRDYGMEEGFEAAYSAARHGWDVPGLRRVLRGEAPPDVRRAEAEDEGDEWQDEEEDEWDEDESDEGKTLTHARLAVLARQGRTDEYLNLARATGRTVAYTTMLARLGRGAEAAAYGADHLAAPGEALALATALSEVGDHDRAMEIAEHGLTLAPALYGGGGDLFTPGVAGFAAFGSTAQLAAWLRDEALALGQRERALRAAERAFREDLSLASYLRAAEIAAESWPDLRTELLDHLRRTNAAYERGHVDVFLHEGLVEDAIAALHPYTHHELVARVADAALAARVRAEWVIQTARRQAEPIMDEGRAAHYDDAARWLGRARDAYRQTGRDDEWRAYRDELLAKHARKYKLVPMIRALG